MPHALVISFVVVVSYITIQYYYYERTVLLTINTIKHLSTFTCFAALEESIHSYHYG